MRRKVIRIRKKKNRREHLVVSRRRSEIAGRVRTCVHRKAVETHLPATHSSSRQFDKNVLDGITCAWANGAVAHRFPKLVGCPFVGRRGSGKASTYYEYVVLMTLRT